MALRELVPAEFLSLVDIAMPTEWAQKTVTLQGKPRGCHVITKELYKLVPEINEFDIGMANIWRALPLLVTSLSSSSLANTALGVESFPQLIVGVVVGVFDSWRPCSDAHKCLAHYQ